jgi:hypothetical protein
MHPTEVELLFRRTAALVVVLTLGAAGWAECAGWQATPEARMACCSGNGDCPMSPGAFSLSLSAALVTSTLTTLALTAAPPASFEAWRTHVPLPVGQVPKHVLLSVFLI